MEIIWTRQALDMVNHFIDYIAQDDPATAEEWAERLLESTNQLIKQPWSGRVVVEFKEENLRELIEGNYRVVYRIREETIYIQAVWHVRQEPKNQP